MTELDILTRLAICHKEITGLKSVLPLPPVRPLSLDELPGCYGDYGEMTNKAPAISAGNAVIARRYRVTVPFAFLGQDDDVDAVGSQAIQQGLTWIERFRTYYLTHPQLQTDGTNQTKLTGLNLPHDIEFRDQGVVAIPASGGSAYIATVFDLDISYRVTNLKRLG